MRSSTLVTWLCATLAAGTLTLACGDDDSKGPVGSAQRESGLGESCTRTSDCEAALVCASNFCQASTGSGGDDGVTPPGPVLGQEGESCTRAADCEADLRCLQEVCTAAAGGDGGQGNVPTGRLGQIGETCQTVRDCAQGLTCIPSPTTFSLGVCDLDEYGLEPTGNMCSSTAECRTAEDCCELPTGLVVTDGSTTTTIYSCADLLAIIAETDCDGTALPVREDQACFYQQTYCGTCAAAAWDCVANKCVYGADCNNDGDVLGGCPARTRAGATATTACDVADSGKCQVPAAGSCTTEASCTSQLVVDSAGLDTCNAGECTCYEAGCYRKCDEHLDCPVRYECDMADEVCLPIGACATDAECATRTFDARAECRAGACVIPCDTDHECSGSGGPLGSSFTSMVCSAAGICEPLGCASDDECPAVNGVKMFCVAPAAVTPGAAVSAITD